MKHKRANKAVSEIVGTTILLAMAIALFSIVQIMAVSFPFNPHPPSARLVANIDGDIVNIIHHGGEPLSSDTRIIFTIDGDTNEQSVGDIFLSYPPLDGDNLWEIGEILKFQHSTDLTGLSVNIVVADIDSNEIIMMSTLQE